MSRRSNVFVFGLSLAAGAALVSCASASRTTESDPIRLTLYPEHPRAYVDDPTPIFFVIRNVSDGPVTIVDPETDPVACFTLALDPATGWDLDVSKVDLGRPIMWMWLDRTNSSGSEREPVACARWDGPLVELPPGAELSAHLGYYGVEVIQEGVLDTPIYSQFHQAGAYRMRARYRVDRESVRGALAASKTPPAHPERLTPLDVTSNEIDVVIYSK